MLNFFMQPFHSIAAGCSESAFFGIPPWYHYLNAAGLMVVDKNTGHCEILRYSNGTGKFGITDFSLIGLGIVDIFLRLAALIAIGYVIYGGFTFITAQGSPDGVKRAQSTIYNALIGLGISIASVGAVSFLANSLGA